MNKDVVIMFTIGVIVTALIAVYYANKGYAVKVGSPLFNAQIN